MIRFLEAEADDVRSTLLSGESYILTIVIGGI